jgi:Fe-S cluster assembly iron-binding protein IscA
MLQLSSSAAAALDQARDEQDVPDSFGLRVSAQPGPDGQTALGLGFAEAPAEGDQVSEQAGTELYVAPEVAEPLADSLIDVEDTPQGLQLVVKPQQPGE